MSYQPTNQPNKNSQSQNRRKTSGKEGSSESVAPNGTEVFIKKTVTE